VKQTGSTGSSKAGVYCIDKSHVSIRQSHYNFLLDRMLDKQGQSPLKSGSDFSQKAGW
jgi:hypothetical protein